MIYMEWTGLEYGRFNQDIRDKFSLIVLYLFVLIFNKL